MNYYVYVHRKKTNGEVFYVGKGCKKRAWANERTIYWANTVAKYGICVHIHSGRNGYTSQETQTFG